MAPPDRTVDLPGVLGPQRLVPSVLKLGRPSVPSGLHETPGIPSDHFKIVGLALWYCKTLQT